MKEYDTDGDGRISKTELIPLREKLEGKQKKNEMAGPQVQIVKAISAYFDTRFDELLDSFTERMALVAPAAKSPGRSIASPVSTRLNASLEAVSPQPSPLSRAASLRAMSAVKATATSWHRRAMANAATSPLTVSVPASPGVALDAVPNFDFGLPSDRLAETEHKVDRLNDEVLQLGSRMSLLMAEVLTMGDALRQVQTQTLAEIRATQAAVEASVSAATKANEDNSARTCQQLAKLASVLVELTSIVSKTGER